MRQIGEMIHSHAPEAPSERIVNTAFTVRDYSKRTLIEFAMRYSTCHSEDCSFPHAWLSAGRGIAILRID